MRKLSIIGIGAGHPDYITVQAIKALETLDVVFLIDKGDEKDDLAKLRRELCDRYIKKPFRYVEAKDPERNHRPTTYKTTETTKHDKRAAIYEAMIRDGLADNQH